MILDELATGANTSPFHVKFRYVVLLPQLEEASLGHRRDCQQFRKFTVRVYLVPGT